MFSPDLLEKIFFLIQRILKRMKKKKKKKKMEIPRSSEYDGWGRADQSKSNISPEGFLLKVAVCYHNIAQCFSY